MKLKVIGGIVSVVLCMVIASCQSEDEIEFKRYYIAGEAIYQQKCQNCHAKTGEGLGALIPSLTDSIYFKKNKNRLACIVKYGIKEKITVHQITYEGNMPGNNDLSPIEIAEVLTYVTNSFGNKMGIKTAQQADTDLRQCK